MNAGQGYAGMIDVGREITPTGMFVFLFFVFFCFFFFCIKLNLFFIFSNYLHSTKARQQAANMNTRQGHAGMIDVGKEITNNNLQGFYSLITTVIITSAGRGRQWREQGEWGSKPVDKHIAERTTARLDASQATSMFFFFIPFFIY